MFVFCAESDSEEIVKQMIVQKGYDRGETKNGKM